MIGITSFGAYIPRLRLQREAIARANTWFDPSLKALAKGERSMCNWDEDSITMAVAAARDATDAGSRSKVRALFLASTSLPFLDRQNAAIVSEALNLGGNLRSMDVSGSQRAATSALLSALDAVEAGCPAALLIGSEHRRSRVGTAMEMLSGDAAAALLIAASNDSIIARFIDSHSITCDFVDHYRTEESEFDYDWEERWIRDEGYMKLVPETVTALLEKTSLAAADIQYFILPGPQQRVPAAVAKQLGFAAGSVVDNLLGSCGQTGVAHPLLLLVHTLEWAQPGERILVTGFGQGCDALLFEAGDAGSAPYAKPKPGVSGWLEQRVAEDNYARFQTFNGLVEREFGKRAEADMPVRPSALYRNRKMVNGFLGGRCSTRGVTNDMTWPNISAPGSFAQLASGYRSAHRVNKRDLKRAMAHVSVKSHANGAKNPKAHLQKQITEEQALNAPMVAEPIGLFDCCGVSDGAACAIVTTPEIARSLGKHNDQLIAVKALQLSVSNGTEAGHNSWDGSYFMTTRAAARRAYAEAGVKNPRAEISMTEVHDCFSITELVTMEDLGIADAGRAVSDILDGEFDAGGRIPCQIDGGLKCFGHPIGASGLRMLYELYLQFQGRAGARQLAAPVLGLTHNPGGFPIQNVCSIAIIGHYQ